MRARLLVLVGAKLPLLVGENYHLSRSPPWVSMRRWPQKQEKSLSREAGDTSRQARAMEHKRVLLVGDRRLLADVVGRLLKAQPNIELLVINPADPDLLCKAKAAQADVIVVPSYNKNVDLERMALILKDNPGTKIISFGLDHTELNIYQSQPAVKASLEELLLAIERRN